MCIRDSLEVAVLDAGLDDIERCGDDDGGATAEDRGDEVLCPGGFVVVGELVDVLFCCC